MNCLLLPLIAAALIAPRALAGTIFSSKFDGNAGATVLAGNTDNISGSSTLTINDWFTASSVTAISGLSAISTGDGGARGGFAQLQNGAATYANTNNIYISRNHNLDADRTSSKRGFSLSFTLDASWDLTTLSILSGHSSNTGNQDQAYSSTLVISLAGGSLDSPVTANSQQNYSSGPAYRMVDFDLSGVTLGAGNYTLEVYQTNMNDGGAYAIYDGITLEGNDDSPPAPRILSFTADKSYVNSGGNVTLSWKTEGAETLSISPEIGDIMNFSNEGNGNTTFTVNSSTTLTLRAVNPWGEATQTLELTSGPPRPNLIVFLADDFGPQDLSVPFTLDSDGNPVTRNFNSFYQTPALDSLASAGMRFTNAYAQSVCSPTRCGLLTGRNSARHAVSDWVGGGGNGSPTNWRTSGINSTDLTLPKLLREAGYRTIHVGKGHFSNSSVPITSLGFDVNIAGSHWGHPFRDYLGAPAYGGMPGMDAYDGSIYLTQALALEANAALEAAVSEGRPFFLNLSFYAVHAPFTTNPNATGNYSSAVNGSHQAFATMVEGMDLAIASILQKLSELGVAKDTLIFFLGDNGSDSPAVSVDGLPSASFSDFPMRGKKGSKWEGGTRIPMIAAWAAADASNPFQQAIPIPNNSIETDIVTSWDVPVTLLHAAGLAKTSGFGEDGHDLTPYLAGQPGQHRPQEIVMHYPHSHRSNYFSWIRQGDLKLIYNFQGNTWQLYDLATDPTESNDLAPTQPETVTRLARALARRLANTWGDPGPLIPTVSTNAPNGNVVSIPDNLNVDLDADGIPDRDEDPDLDGLVDPGETDPDSANTDGDNLNDGDELKTGTDPLNPSSFFRVTLEPDSSAFVLSWPSSPGALYRIESTIDPGGNLWAEVIDNLAASSGDETRYAPGPIGPDPRRFYRVGLKSSETPKIGSDLE